MSEGINRLIATQQAPDLLGAVTGGIQAGQSMRANEMSLQRAQAAQQRQNRLLELAGQGAQPEQMMQEGFIDEASKLVQIRSQLDKNQQAEFDRDVQEVSALTAGARTPEEFNQRIMNAPQGLLSPETQQIAVGLGPQGLQQLAQQLSHGGMSAAQQEFQSLTAGMSPEEVERARRIELGLAPRAVGSSSQTITDEGRAAEIAETEATIAERKKFAEMTGASRAKKIDEGFDRIVEIDQGISNIDNAITALNEGAKTGPLISKYTPTIRAQTAKLEQVRNMMALDVLNAATFGALSEKELEIVKETALPNLPPDQLREWLETRKAAEQKLRAYYQEQIDFLDQGGSVAGFLRMKERQRTGQGDTQQGQQSATGAASSQPKFLGFE